MSAGSYTALCCLPHSLNPLPKQTKKNKTKQKKVTPSFFTSFYTALAEQKAEAQKHPFIFEYEILCVLNYFYK